MSDDEASAKLTALHDRLRDEQRRYLLAAADIDALPPAGVLSKIADLENAILATERAMD